MLIFSVQSGAAITEVMDFSRLLALNAIEGYPQGTAPYRCGPHWSLDLSGFRLLGARCGRR
jgi:hypothetical protein